MGWNIFGNRQLTEYNDSYQQGYNDGFNNRAYDSSEVEDKQAYNDGYQQGVLDRDE